MHPVAWVIVALVVGMLPSPYLIAVAMRRTDVISQMRRKDSPGDAHFLVTTQISKTVGVISIIMDMVKGFVPGLIAARVPESPSTLALIGIAAVVGHSFAPFLRSTGGRGLTTAAGVCFAIIPRAMTGVGVIAFIGTVTRRGGQGTGMAFALLPIVAWMFGYPRELIAMAVAIALLIMARRLEGIGDDMATGVPFSRAFLSRALYDLPMGKRQHG